MALVIQTTGSAYGRLRMLAVRPGPVRLRLLALEERDRGICSSLRLVRHVLVDRARLPAGDDVLDTPTDASCPESGIGWRCFAFRSAMTAPAMLSFAASTPWMLLFVLTSIWLKMVAALFASQSGTNCCGPRLIFLVAKSGLKTLLLPLWNQNAFWSVWPPQQLGDRAARVGPLRLHRGDDAVGLGLADRHAVERDVHRGGAAGHLAVVVDRLAALRGEELLDRRGGAVVERGLDDDRRARGDTGLRLCLLLERVVEGVVDRST